VIETCSIHFTGVVHPERANVNIAGLKLDLIGDVRGEAFIAIECSQLRISIRTDNPIDITTLRNSIQSLAGHVVNCLGFVLGCGYEVELIQLLKDEDGQVVFGVGYPALQERPPAVTFDRLLVLIEGQFGVFLQRALGDFKDAIRRPHDSAFHCYRAIESVMQYFKARDGVVDKGAWETMRAALSVEKENLIKIKDLADPARHGGVAPIPSAERDFTVLTTQAIIERFAEHLTIARK